MLDNQNPTYYAVSRGRHPNRFFQNAESLIKYIIYYGINNYYLYNFFYDS